MTLTDVAQPQNHAPIYLDITGMSCLMCSGKVQKTLNKIDGVRASVSFATKSATIETDGGTSAAELCDAVRAAGYDAQPRDTAPEVVRGPLQRLADGVLGRTR
ncbi:hypothetical protein BOO86_19130 [Mycobacterium sp. CBMA 234]|uniref:cation transporter n=1 Tax=Mycolicibacterium sp. CBMA 234 TaxID=1918495 RepID=UPI0012DE6555|nr:cation transporter [Mycolicibacterium sp. CBMA 234]MUL66597.1 hypothetical protein [Mycolicibacterium sp. CBMA 234]